MELDEGLRMAEKICDATLNGDVSRARIANDMALIVYMTRCMKDADQSAVLAHYVARLLEATTR